MCSQLKVSENTNGQENYNLQSKLKDQIAERNINRKTMRRANGQGSIHKLSGRRRYPWAVNVTVGWKIIKDKKPAKKKQNESINILVIMLQKNRTLIR